MTGDRREQLAIARLAGEWEFLEWELPVVLGRDPTVFEWIEYDLARERRAQHGYAAGWVA